MSNSEYIKSLNESELTDYLFAIYLSGRLSAKMDANHEKYDTTNLLEWLQSERESSNEKK